MALLTLTAPQTILLTTLDRAKAEFGIAGTDTSNDEMLLAMLGRVSDAIATECGRPYFGVGTYLETLKGSGSQLLSVNCVPVLGIASILQDTDALFAIDPSNPNDPNLTDGYYVEDARVGAIYRPAGWGQTVALMSWGWEAYSSRYILPGGTSTLRYTITYTAGYRLPIEETLLDPVRGWPALYDPTSGYAPYDPVGGIDAPPLPGEIEQAALITLKSWWYERDRDYTVAAAQVDNVRVQFAAPEKTVLPTRALGLLRNHRRIA